MSNLYTAILTADTNGGQSKVFSNPGYNLNAFIPAIPDNNGNVTASDKQQIDHYLTGDVYSVEYDSTGEVYVQFLDRGLTPVSDVVLLHKGVMAHISASVIRILAVRRAGILRITASGDGFGLRVNNPPTDIVRRAGIRYAVSVNGTTGPTGWVNTSSPLQVGNCSIAYNANPLGFGGVLQPQIKRIAHSTLVAANFRYLSYGFVHVYNGSVNQVGELCNVVTNGIESDHVFNDIAPLDIAPYMYPAVIWQLTAAGVTANAGPPQANFDFSLGNVYLRPDGGMALDVV